MTKMKVRPILPVPQEKPDRISNDRYRRTVRSSHDTRVVKQPRIPVLITKRPSLILELEKLPSIRIFNPLAKRHFEDTVCFFRFLRWINAPLLPTPVKGTIKSLTYECPRANDRIKRSRIFCRHRDLQRQHPLHRLLHDLSSFSGRKWSLHNRPERCLINVITHNHRRLSAVSGLRQERHQTTLLTLNPSQTQDDGNSLISQCHRRLSPNTLLPDFTTIDEELIC